MDRIYLDHAATSPVLPQVLEVMLPFFQHVYGNPSSIHSFGREARDFLDEARERAAECLGCAPKELIFTSGGTESDNAAIVGVLRAAGPDKLHVITTAVEHHAVLNTCRQLERDGYRITVIGVDSSGRVDPEDIERAITPDTGLISVMHTNNETGTIQPVEVIGQIARDRGIPFHMDAVQALGSLSRPLSEFPVDLVSFSAHKIGGPKGAGALYVSPRLNWLPTVLGGAQESRRRAGTENISGIVGFSKALEVTCGQRAEYQRHYESLSQSMLRVFAEELEPHEWTVNGHATERSPHILNVSFPGTESETLLMRLDMEGVAASSGSACSSGSMQPSHVLESMALADEVKRSSIRFSFGPDTTREQIVRAAKITATIARARS